MRQTTGTRRSPGEKIVKDIKRATDKLPMLKRVDPDGCMSLRAIAEALNANGVPTVSGGGQWLASSVRRLKAIAA